MTTVGVAATSALALTCIGLFAMVLARRRVMLVTVLGQSMAPTYQDGDRLLVVRRSGCVRGDVVMFRTPVRHLVDVDWMVKRAVALPGDTIPDDLQARIGLTTVPAGRLLVRSDALEGLDSRHFGLIDAGDVLGVVVRSTGYASHSAAKSRISSCSS